MYHLLICDTKDCSGILANTLLQKSHQVTTMLATSKNDLFTGHNHLVAAGTDGPSLAGT